MANNTERILNNPLLMIFAVILTILIIFSLRESEKKALVSKENLAASQQYIDDLRQNVDQKAEAIYVISDDLYKEKSLRNELLKKKDGEIILQVPINNDHNASENDTENGSKKQTLLEEKNHNWQLWWNLLF